MDKPAGPRNLAERPREEDGSDATAEHLSTPEEHREQRRARLLGWCIGVLGVLIFQALRILGVDKGFAMLPIALAGVFIYFRIAPKLPEYRLYFEAVTVERPGWTWFSRLQLVVLAILFPLPVSILLRSGFSRLSNQELGILVSTAILIAWIVFKEVNKRVGHESQLWRAAMNDNHRSVRRQLAGGASPNELDPNGNPVLVWPVVNGNLQILKLLLEAGANPNATVYTKRKGEFIQVNLRDLALTIPGAAPSSGRRSFFPNIYTALVEAERSRRAEIVKILEEVERSR